jgi:hypothetical protein
VSPPSPVKPRGYSTTNPGCAPTGRP